jgi:hypothetical protein
VDLVLAKLHFHHVLTTSSNIDMAVDYIDSNAVGEVAGKNWSADDQTSEV